MLNERNYTKRSRSLGTLASVGLLAAGMLGAACGDIDTQDGDSRAPTTSTATATQALDRNPVGDYYDEAGNYFLECNTGADLGPIQVTPTADVGGWMSACMDGLLGQSGSGATDAEINECRRDVLDFFGSLHSKPYGALKAQRPIDGYNWNGHWWSVCNTGAELDHFMHTSSNGDAYQDWKAECLAGVTPGVGVGVVHPTIHRGLGERTGKSSRGPSVRNPVCEGLMGGRIETRTAGFVYACSSTKRVSKGSLSRDEFRVFAQECKDNGNGNVSELVFKPGTTMNHDMIYVCSSTGETLQHKEGYEALQSFSSECASSEGNVLHRSFDDPEVGDYIRYFCSSTGETLPHSDGQSAYDAFELDCLQRGGRTISNIDYAYADVEPTEPVGRDGRDDEHTERGNVVPATDSNGDRVYVCRPRGGMLKQPYDIHDYNEFVYNCEQEGGTIATWTLYQRAERSR